MALETPKLPALVERILDDIDSYLPGRGSQILRTVVNVIGRVLASAANDLYLYTGAAVASALPDKADAAGLARWAQAFGVTRAPARKAEGPIEVGVVVNQSLAALTRLVSGGVQYEVVSTTALTSPVTEVTVRAVVGGVAANRPPGAILQFVQPISGLASEAIVVGDGIEDGADIEDLELWRERVLLEMRRRGGPGTLDDYQRWAREVSGVWRAWARRGTPIGSVDVWIVQFGTGTGIEAPSPLRTEVYDHIVAKHLPVPVWRLTVSTATVILQAFTIELDPDTSQNRSAYAAALESYLLASVDPRGMTLKISRMERVGGAGIDGVTITSPGADIVVPVGSVVLLGAITWA